MTSSRDSTRCSNRTAPGAWWTTRPTSRTASTPSCPRRAARLQPPPLTLHSRHRLTTVDQPPITSRPQPLTTRHRPSLTVRHQPLCTGKTLICSRPPSRPLTRPPRFTNRPTNSHHPTIRTDLTNDVK